MTKLSNKFKKPCFWPIFGPLSHFSGKKIFLKKSGPVMHNKTWAPNTMLSFRKKLMSQSHENFQRRTEGQTLIHRTLPARTRGPKIAIWAGHEEQIINYEWPYDHGTNASKAVKKILTDQKEYQKCCKSNLLNSQNIPFNQ